MGAIATIILVVSFIGWAVYFYLVHLPKIIQKRKAKALKAAEYKKTLEKENPYAKFRAMADNGSEIAKESIADLDAYEALVNCAKTLSNTGMSACEVADALKKMGDTKHEESPSGRKYASPGTIIDVKPRKK